MIRLSNRVFLAAAGLFLITLHLQAGEFELSFRSQVGGFISGLDKNQRDGCLLEVDDNRRWKMQYTGGKRAGIKIGDLNAKQRVKLEKVMRMVLSDEGWTMANKVAQQDGPEGLGKYWVACFGDPRTGDPFAFRIAEHHLTVVHLEVAKGETKEFGPILLGANPPKLWQADEEALMQVWNKMGAPKPLIKDKAAIASEPMQTGEGMLFGTLNEQARSSIKKAWDQRLSIFTPPIRKRINRLHQARGGWGKSRVSFYKEGAEKRCVDGGRWDFKCGLPGMVWDFESSRAHIHMSLWVK